MRLSRIPENLLLRSAPRGKRALNQLKHVVFDTGDVLWSPGIALPYVMFPLRGVISLQVWPANDGKQVDVGVVGPEGFAEVTSLLGADETRLGAVGLTSGEAVIVEPDQFATYLGDRQFRDAMQRYVRMFLVMLNQTAVCNRIHVIDKMLISRLLLIQDRTHADSFQLTQEFLSRVLGVRKASISRAAARLQREDAISYDRQGRLTIVDRRKLEREACSCYHAIKSETNQLIGALGGF